MTRNTLYAVLLSILVITGSFYIQTRFFTPESTPVSPTAAAAEPAPFIQAASSDAAAGSATPAASVTQTGSAQAAANSPATSPAEAEPIVITTDAFTAELSAKNATVTSLVKKRMVNGAEELVDLLPQAGGDEAFRVLLGDAYAAAGGAQEAFTSGKLQDVIFDVTRPDARTVVFSKDFTTQDGQFFTLSKTYAFKDGEDVFELYVSIKNKNNDVLRLGDSAYTLTFGPQLGPSHEVTADQKTGGTNQRWFVGLLGNKLKTIRLKRGRVSERSDQYKWSGISGRYFSLLVLTNTARYTTTFSATPVEGLSSGAHIAYTRAALQSSAIEDVFRVYVGAMSGTQLSRYNDSSQNAFQISNAEFSKIKPRRLLSFLENLFSWVLNSIYKFIPNYGVAIILLTLLVRFATLPIMNRSKKNGEKMKALGPKMQEIRERFPDDRTRQSQELLELYRREHFSPFSSFLPVLIQIPVFLAMYRVIYESFDLWRQPFAGWMRDLSEPDMLLSFGGATVPLLNWTGLNVLPIIMLVTQFWSGWILTKQQAPTAGAPGGRGMMLFLSYGFPFIIFFALYNSASGLILYWIVSNIFTVLSMMNWKKNGAAQTAAAGSSGGPAAGSSGGGQKTLPPSAKKDALKKAPKRKTFMQRVEAYAAARRKELAKQRKK